MTTPHLTHTPLSVQQLSFFHKKRCILHNVSFETEPSGITGLLGINGAGKSTLLSLLAAHTFPASGTISLGPITTHTHTAQWHKLVAFLPETPALEPHLTTQQHILFIAQIAGLPLHDARHKTQHIVEKLQLQNVLHTPTKHLSFGFKKRVALASTLVTSPHLLLLDEPGAGLDPSQLVTLRHTLQELAQDHKIILSSHIIHELSLLTSSILTLHNTTLTPYHHQDLDTPLYILRIQPHQRELAAHLLAQLDQVSMTRSSTPDTLQLMLPENLLSHALQLLLSHGIQPLEWFRPSHDDELEAKFLMLTQRSTT